MIGSSLERRIEAGLRRWVGAVRRRAVPVAWLLLLATPLLGLYALLQLGINADNLGLISDRLPSRQDHLEYTELFGNLDNAILVVIDAETPELARRATADLETRLRARPERFTEVDVPGNDPFFELHALLYRSADELDEFADQVIRMQPVLASLEREPSISKLAEMIQLSLDEVEAQGSGEDEWSPG